MLSEYKYHEPVLLEEVLKALNIDRLARLHGTKVIDATLGFGGHTISFLNKGIDVLGFEADQETFSIAKTIINSACPASKGFGGAQLVNANFKDIDSIAKASGFGSVDAILFDLGVSTYQLTNSSRGFSFSHPDSELDMRIDKKNQAVTAAMLINALDITQLTNLFSRVLTAGESRSLAKKIVNVRRKHAFVKVADLLAVLRKNRSKKINPATKAFMALRIAVNSEYENILEGLPKAFSLLKKGGRIAAISFHSGEDLIVKSYFKNLASQNKAIIITAKPVVPSESEIISNPRSRSAKLRVIEKI